MSKGKGFFLHSTCKFPAPIRNSRFNVRWDRCRSTLTPDMHEGHGIRTHAALCQRVVIGAHLLFVALQQGLLLCR